jgi:hypothetical protein
VYLQTRCQDNDDDDIEGEQEEQAELDASLMEHAGDVIPQLAAAAPGQEFVAYFASLLPWFLKRMVSFRQWRVNIGARGDDEMDTKTVFSVNLSFVHCFLSSLESNSICSRSIFFSGYGCRGMPTVIFQ